MSEKKVRVAIVGLGFGAEFIPIYQAHPNAEMYAVCQRSKDKLDAYKAMSQECRPVWREYGAIDYVECVGDDVPYGEWTSFPRAVQATEDEVVIFSWITYESREARDTANNKAMNDPRMKKYENNVPFDVKRMIYGGFKPFLGL